VTLRRSKVLQAAAIAAVATPAFEALGATLHWSEEGVEHLDAIARSGHQPIFVFWHGRILSAMLYFRDRGIIVMTSENFDGEWIARVIRRFGYGSARGSTSRGGSRALVQLRRDMAAGSPAAFTVDGPRGPARVAQAGAVWLAGATGNPLLPFHIEAARYWQMTSWDKHQVPKPGTDIAIAIGAPIEVPRKPSDETIESTRVELERVLGGLEERAFAMIGRNGGPV